MDEKNNGAKFVSYRWLIGTAVSILGIIIVMMFFFYNSTQAVLNTKVDASIFTERTNNMCKDIADIKTKGDSTLSKISEIEKTLIRMESLLPNKKELKAREQKLW